MNITTHHIEVTKNARFAMYGEPSEKTKYFWIVLHGSKMLCEQMIYKFVDFDPKIHFVIAPEGMNKFYSKGFSGDIVASWMTSRDRLFEINDFSNYLSKLYNQYLDKLPSSVRKIALGFSQGGTTMY
ncbi:MAG: phospholipase, partial [Bacteroidia bacterium]|nr:phospholipase [Bacteroidia bacterium]